MRPPDEAGTGSIHLVIVRIAKRLAGDEHQIPTGLDFILPLPHGFTQAALDAITHHGVSDPATDGEAEATVGQTVRQYAEDQ